MNKKPLVGPDDVISWGPVYGSEKESTEPYVVCANCDEVRKDHLDDGKCAFDSTFFAARVLVTKVKMGATTQEKAGVVKRIPK